MSDYSDSLQETILGLLTEIRDELVGSTNTTDTGIKNHDPFLFTQERIDPNQVPKFTLIGSVLRAIQWDGTYATSHLILDFFGDDWVITQKSRPNPTTLILYNYQLHKAQHIPIRSWAVLRPQEDKAIVIIDKVFKATYVPVEEWPS